MQLVMLSEAEESLIVFSAAAENDKSEMFRFAQHDRTLLNASTLFLERFNFCNFFNVVTLL